MVRVSWISSGTASSTSDRHVAAYTARGAAAPDAV